MSGAIASVSSNTFAAAARPETLEPPGRDTKKDNDKDDTGAVTAAASSAPKPTVNTQGQTIGTVLNTKA